MAMREHGFDGVGVAELMKRAGLTHGGFYAHFSSRDELVAHSVDRMFQDSSTLLARHLTGQEARAGLASLIDAYLSIKVLRSPEAGCPLPSLSGEARRMPQAARQRFVEGVEAFIGALERALAEIGRPDPAVLAASLLSELVGSVALARTLDGKMAAGMLEAARESMKIRFGLGSPPARHRS
jgi:TetR/AcrR family transcriptional repressor of nem operon